MREPSSPRAWLLWAARVLEAHARPFSPRLDHTPRGDFRLRDSRETALSVKLILERAGKGDRGRGARLLVAHYVGEMSWHSFSPRERKLIAKIARRFRCSLCTADFLELCGRPGRWCARKKGVPKI